MSASLGHLSTESPKYWDRDDLRESRRVVTLEVFNVERKVWSY